MARGNIGRCEEIHRREGKADDLICLRVKHDIEYVKSRKRFDGRLLEEKQLDQETFFFSIVTSWQRSPAVGNSSNGQRYCVEKYRTYLITIAKLWIVDTVMVFGFSFQRLQVAIFVSSTSCVEI